jgi:hypothetical protein
LESVLLLLLEVLLERIQISNLLLLLLLKLDELLLFLFVDAWDLNHEKFLEPGAHLFLLTEGVQADDKVEANIELWLVIHNVLVDLDSLTESLLLDQSQSHVLLDLKLHLFILL